MTTAVLNAPRSRPLVGFMPEFMRDPLRLLERLATYGDLVPLYLGRQRTWLVNHPDLIKQLLVTRQKSVTKSRFLTRSRAILGNGLLSSEGEFHARQRKLMQPAFHRQRIEGYASEMIAYAICARSRWTDGANIDMSQEMMRLTLDIVAKTLFGAEVDDEANEIGLAITDLLRLFNIMLLPFGPLLQKLPLPSNKRFWRARARLDNIIYGLIALRRASSDDRGDLLSMLLMAQDEAEGAMSDTQVRDEAMTLFLAGHETTANALTWTWYLLSTHADVEARMHAEIDAQIGRRDPTPADYFKLPYTYKVLRESMRLYPPAWIMSRLTTEPFELNGQPLRADDLCIMSPWVIHHDGRWHTDPTRFWPERWTDESEAATSESASKLPKFAYFPFGGGARACIGEQFAWMEGVLLLATLARDWRFRFIGDKKPVPLPVITLRSRYGMPMRVERRTSPLFTSAT